MKKLLVLLLAILPLAMQGQIKQDKLMHAGAGVVISESTFLASQWVWKDAGTSARMSMALVTLSGFGKEMFDAFDGRDFSWTDCGTTIIFGYITSGINYLIFKRKKNKKKQRDPFDIGNDPLVKTN